MLKWSVRDLTREDAARLCGMPAGTLASLIHRARDVSVLFTERRKGRRWFSLRDIAVLRIGAELEKAGAVWLQALADAYNALQQPPPPDAILVAPTFPMKGSGGPRLIADRDVPRLLIDRTYALVPIGLICQTIIKEAERSVAV